MATKGERQALFFLASVALLGAGARACGAHRADPVAGDLGKQIVAVETSRARGRDRGRQAPRTRGRGAGLARSDSAKDTAASRQPAMAAESSPRSRVDLDAATEQDVKRLPGVGPSIAKRIIANRNAQGAFGCLAALDVVKGVGPAMLRRLDSLVSFSGAPRQACR